MRQLASIQRIKELGNILKEVFDLQLDGILTTKEDQLNYAKERLK